jgi:hypothetical protein
MNRSVARVPRPEVTAKVPQATPAHDIRNERRVGFEG